MFPSEHSFHQTFNIADLHEARARMRGWIEAAGVSCDDSVLVASELLTNAIVHADFAPTLVVRLGPHLVRVEVGDDSSVPPLMSAVRGEHGGFGLRIVDAASEAWGWFPTLSGKTVWSDIPIHRPP